MQDVSKVRIPEFLEMLKPVVNKVFVQKIKEPDTANPFKKVIKSRGVSITLG